MNGTTTCSYLASIHLEGTKVLVDVIRGLGQRAFVGKVWHHQAACPELCSSEMVGGCSFRHIKIRSKSPRLVMLCVLLLLISSSATHTTALSECSNLRVC